MSENLKDCGLPEWMSEHEKYEAPKGKERFADLSSKAFLNVLSRMKYRTGKEKKYSPSASFRLFFTLLMILLVSASSNYFFVLIAGTVVLVLLAMQTGEMVKQILTGSVTAVLISFLILLPAVFMGNPKILMTICTKVMISVTLTGLLSSGSSWNKLTGALRTYHVPAVFIFTLDMTIKYIAVLGEIGSEALVSLRLRSVGINRKKESSAGGVLGITFLKSQEMSEETYQAMICRGFTGEYAKNKHDSFQKQDLVYALFLMLITVLYFYLN